MCGTTMMRLTFVAAILFATAAWAEEPTAKPTAQLFEWERGIGIQSPHQPEMKVYLWFYEWNMFGAYRPEQHTRGNWSNKISLNKERTAAQVTSDNPGIALSVKALADGAELILTVTNKTKHDWPELASMVACFNPGPKEVRNTQFANTNTWFNSSEGLRKLAMQAPREIHYNHQLQEKIRKQADNRGLYVWSSKWPTSKIDALDGLIIRESTDRKWVTGIAWDRFLACQGHNPWECMHLSVNVGPLKQKATRTVRGRIYLLGGKKEDVLAAYQRDFKQ